jgi:hypothetical protein
MLEASRCRGSRIATRSTRAAGFRGGNSSVAGNCYETFSESRRAVKKHPRPARVVDQKQHVVCQRKILFLVAEYHVL